MITQPDLILKTTFWKYKWLLNSLFQHWLYIAIRALMFIYPFKTTDYNWPSSCGKPYVGHPFWAWRGKHLWDLIAGSYTYWFPLFCHGKVDDAHLILRIFLFPLSYKKMGPDDKTHYSDDNNVCYPIMHWRLWEGELSAWFQTSRH